MNKKLLLLSGLICASASLNAQIFSENFNASTVFPTGWARYNVDGRTPATNVNYMGTNAWIVKAAANTAYGNVLFSSSWYTPAGASDDWAVTPPITIPATGNFRLTYDVLSLDPAYLESYKVYISTTGNTVADFTQPEVLSEAAASNWTTKTIDLSGYTDETIYIAFRNVSNDKFVMNLDNVKVSEVFANDAKLETITLNRYSMINTNNTLSLRVKNDGSNPITGVKINWNDGADHIQTVTTNIAPGSYAIVNHPTAVNSATATQKDITVTITEVNGGADSQPSNNGGTTKFNAVSAMAEKNVVAEEGTGTWCQFCPRGAVAMDYMYTNYPSRFIGIAVHNQDPMTVAAYDAGANFSGFPGSNIDRVLLDQEVSQSAFEGFYNARKDLIVPAAISGTTSSTGTSVSIIANADFKTQVLNPNYRLAVVIMEDSVTGTATGYRQVNAYAGGAYGPMGGYESLPNPVPANQMVYNHVGRALLGGYAGQTGSVPTTINDGTTASYTFTYTVPATSNRAKMKAVIMLIDQTNGEIVNAKAIPLPLAPLGVADNAADIKLNVYPNPATDILKLDFEAKNANYDVTIYDLQGREVKTQSFSNLSGAQSLELNVNSLTTGNYLISVSTEGNSFTQQVVIK